LTLRVTKFLVTTLALLYAAPVVAWLFFRAWRGETWPMIGLMNAGGLWWFAPLLVLLPIALLVRARQATFTTLLLLVAAVVLFGEEFVPHFPREVADDVPRLRVLSFNAHVDNRAFDVVERMVREQNPDIFAIQELSPEMAQHLNDRLGEEYRYQILNPWTDPRGIGMWSRYPLIEAERFDLELWEGWGQTAIVNVDGQPLYFINVHLWPIGTLDRDQFARGLARQRQQAITLRDHVAAINGPVLLVGDFNASPTNDSHRLMSEVMTDVWRQVAMGPGFTWPAPGSVNRFARPFLRIDYMWTKGAIQPLNIRVLPRAASDHLPLFAEFVIERDEAAP
jgi:vancomycin resistance protein VanJ